MRVKNHSKLIINECIHTSTSTFILYCSSIRTNEKSLLISSVYHIIVYCNTDFSLFTSSMDKDGKCCVALSFSLFRYVFFFHFYSYVFITFVTCTKGRRDKYTMEIVDVFQLMLQHNVCINTLINNL